MYAGANMGHPFSVLRKRNYKSQEVLGKENRAELTFCHRPSGPRLDCTFHRSQPKVTHTITSFSIAPARAWFASLMINALVNSCPLATRSTP